MNAHAGIAMLFAFALCALGLYVLATDRLPRWVRENDRHEPQAYGWAKLLMAAFITMLVVPQTTDLPYGLVIGLMTLGLLAAAASWWLTLKRIR
ncbi:hypothetical protein [Streptosporangium carneum]|uniref:DUF3325 domain-containing protein n=1 Tax=Streptosporangium carneum TaxID=47481 RepID=A0A9W6HXI2_9ACTN|nr:hypothetical protein [Streptosporangium carneum]GLK07205.1 hypothetical protein GCM10017600_06100 [Streptosporangium carneum]